MRTSLLCCATLALLAEACGGTNATFVHANTTTLGRVVVYRNGVAYFERTAHVVDDKLDLAVPADKVDDFLKSLTVVDARTGEPAPIAYPTSPEPASTGTGLIDMQIHLQGRSPHDLKLSYVTEAPAWKPSYRVVLGGDKKVSLVGWAVVDNTSGEDWSNVRLGVGASSALSFRFDLRSIRVVERETLQTNDLFALAPPTGEATYGGASNALDLTRKVLGNLRDEQLQTPTTPADTGAAAASIQGAQITARSAPMSGNQGLGAGRSAESNFHNKMPQPKPAPDPVGDLARQVQQGQRPVVIEGFAKADDGDKQVASMQRANNLRNQLLQRGVDASQIVAVGRGEQPGHVGGVRVIEAPPVASAYKKGEKDNDGKPDANPNLDPIGTSHFESQQAMTVPHGTSAMVSILDGSTEGEVVYLYDPESARGNASFAFKSLRLRNPTDSQLESGPVTVFGEGRFVGEGLSEPIPAHQIAFVPFALDRQIVVDESDTQREEIAKIITVNRGVFSTQVQHIKKTTLVLHNRLPSRAVVYVRHTTPSGYRVSHAPTDPEHVAGAELYRVEVEGLGKQEVVIEEATPVYRTADLRTAEGRDLVRVYLSSAAVEGPLKAQVEDLLRTQKDMGDYEQRIATLREQMGEYRQRMDELHAQVVTLKAVRTAGPLMASLEKKLQDMSDRLSKATIDVVGLEEKLMLERIKFQDAVADLTLEDSAKVAKK
jgi:outer membrane protein OmpA-like peptidoglycan-associated protein